MIGWPFGVFLMKQFSENIPTELLESAKIDGCGEIRTFWSVAFPIVKPGFAALAIFTFINTWNDYFMQLVMLTSRNNLTISLGVATMQAEMATNYGLIMAGAALAAVPIITVFLVFQNPSLKVLLWELSKVKKSKLVCQDGGSSLVIPWKYRVISVYKMEVCSYFMKFC